MEELFINDALRDRIDESGVVTVPLLNAEELQALRDFYQELHPDGIPPQLRDGIHMTIWCADYDYKVRIRERLMEIVMPACERYFKDFRIVTPVFIVKVKGEQTKFPIHQDWNVVDEEQHRAFNVWIPLHDVDSGNGSLWHVPGSHRLPTVIRGAGLLFPNLYPIESHIRPVMKSLDLEAGQAMVFYHRLIHGSPPNLSEEPRVVVSFTVLPKEVPMHIYFQKDAESPLQIYHPPDDFIYQFENVRDHTDKLPPKGLLVAERPPHVPVRLTPEVFDAHFPGLVPAESPSEAPPPAPKAPRNFFQRLISKFS